LYLKCSRIIGLAVQRVIEIIGRELALQIDELKCIQNLEGKRGIGFIKGCWKQGCRKELRTSMRGTSACTRPKSDGMDAIDIDDGKSFDRRTGAGAGLAVMTKKNFKSE
jgi:hypothetical protein